MDVSFGTIWEAVARELPEAVAISEPGRDLTYAAFEDRAARLAAALVRAGVGPGDKVACYLHNSAAYLETVFAALKIGAVPVNANYRYTRDELSSLLADADAAALVFGGELAANVGHAALHVETLRLLVRVGPPTEADPGPECAELEDLLAATRPRPAEPRPGSDLFFVYTGGTTGRPKGVIWRQSDLLHALAVPVFRPLGLKTPPATLDEAVRVAVAARHLGRAPATMPVAPLMHATGLFNAMGALLAGGRVIMTRRGGLDPRHVWETVVRERAGTVIVAGDAICRPLVEELVSAEKAGDPYDLSRLGSVISSGATLHDRLKLALHDRADVTVIDAIASTEGGPFAFAITTGVGDLPSRFYPAPATRVLTADGALTVRGEIGMLAYRGPMPLGYHKDPAGTEATFRTIDGVRWSIPGDLARIEPDGSIGFLGRGSGVINTGGEKVHPKEVEDVLLTHPDVTDAVVVGVPDEVWGERVAAVVATSNPLLTSHDLQDAVRARLAGYKLPRIIVILPTLPRTPTGKIELAWAIETARRQCWS